MSDPFEQARARFAELADDADREVPLTEAALWIAAEEYEDLDVAAYLERVEELAADADSFVGSGGSERERIDRLNEYLFEKQRFIGNRNDYYDCATAF